MEARITSCKLLCDSTPDSSLCELETQGGSGGGGDSGTSGDSERDNAPDDTEDDPEGGNKVKDVGEPKNPPLLDLEEKPLSTALFVALLVLVGGAVWMIFTTKKRRK